MFSNKYAALQWRLKKRNELLVKLERVLRELQRLDREIEALHGRDEDTAETVFESLYEARSIAET